MLAQAGQQPHPPILVGGNAPKVVDRVVRFGDVWAPNRVTPEDLPGRMEELRRKADEAGRGEIPVNFFGAKPEREVLDRLADAGVERCVFYLPSDEAGDVERRLGRYAELL